MLIRLIAISNGHDRLGSFSRHLVSESLLISRSHLLKHHCLVLFLLFDSPEVRWTSHASLKWKRSSLLLHAPKPSAKTRPPAFVPQDGQA